MLINEIWSHTDPPFESAIELYNPGTQPIDIGGWYLSDAMNNLKKYRIPMGTEIAPMGFHVAYEHQFLIQNTLAPFALSSAFESGLSNPSRCEWHFGGLCGRHGISRFGKWSNHGPIPGWIRAVDPLWIIRHWEPTFATPTLS